MRINLVLALALFNMTGTRASRMLAVFYALQLGAQPFTIGALAATFALFPLLLSWPAGRIADRYGPRWPLTLGALVSACGMLLPAFWPTLPAIFVAATMNGIGSTYYSIALQNMVGTLSSAETRARNYSNYAMAISVAAAAGPLMAGFAFDTSGPVLSFLYAALCLMVPVGMLSVWGGLLPRGEPKSKSAPAMNVRDTLTNPGVWPVLVASSLAQSGLDIFQFYIPVYGDAHGLSASAIGVVIGMCAVGGFAARMILPRLINWLNEEKVLAYALVLGGVESRDGAVRDDRRRAVDDRVLFWIRPEREPADFADDHVRAFAGGAFGRGARRAVCGGQRHQAGGPCNLRCNCRRGRRHGIILDQRRDAGGGRFAGAAGGEEREG